MSCDCEGPPGPPGPHGPPFGPPGPFCGAPHHPGWGPPLQPANPFRPPFPVPPNPTGSFVLIDETQEPHFASLTLFNASCSSVTVPPQNGTAGNGTAGNGTGPPPPPPPPRDSASLSYLTFLATSRPMRSNIGWRQRRWAPSSRFSKFSSGSEWSGAQQRGYGNASQSSVRVLFTAVVQFADMDGDRMYNPAVDKAIKTYPLSAPVWGPNPYLPYNYSNSQQDNRTVYKIALDTKDGVFGLEYLLTTRPGDYKGMPLVPSGFKINVRVTNFSFANATNLTTTINGGGNSTNSTGNATKPDSHLLALKTVLVSRGASSDWQGSGSGSGWGWGSGSGSGSHWPWGSGSGSGSGSHWPWSGSGSGSGSGSHGPWKQQQQQGQGEGWGRGGGRGHGNGHTNAGSWQDGGGAPFVSAAAATPAAAAAATTTTVEDWGTAQRYRGVGNNGRGFGGGSGSGSALPPPPPVQPHIVIGRNLTSGFFSWNGTAEVDGRVRSIRAFVDVDSPQTDVYLEAEDTVAVLWFSVDAHKPKTVLWDPMVGYGAPTSTASPPNVVPPPSQQQQGMPGWQVATIATTSTLAVLGALAAVAMRVRRLRRRRRRVNTTDSDDVDGTPLVVAPTKDGAAYAQL